MKANEHPCQSTEKGHNVSDCSCSLSVASGLDCHVFGDEGNNQNNSKPNDKNNDAFLKFLSKLLKVHKFSVPDWFEDFWVFFYPFFMFSAGMILAAAVLLRDLSVLF